MAVDQQHEYAKSIYQSQGGEDRVGTPLLLFAVWPECSSNINVQTAGVRQGSDRLTRSVQQQRRKIGSREKLELPFASRRIVPRVLVTLHTYSALNLAWGQRALRCRFSVLKSIRDGTQRKDGPG